MPCTPQNSPWPGVMASGWYFHSGFSLLYPAASPSPSHSCTSPSGVTAWAPRLPAPALPTLPTASTVLHFWQAPAFQHCNIISCVYWKDLWSVKGAGFIIVVCPFLIKNTAFSSSGNTVCQAAGQEVKKMAIRLDIREGDMAVKHASNSASWGAVGRLQRQRETWMYCSKSNIPAVKRDLNVKLS